MTAHTPEAHHEEVPVAHPAPAAVPAEAASTVEAGSMLTPQQQVQGLGALRDLVDTAKDLSRVAAVTDDNYAMPLADLVVPMPMRVGAHALMGVHATSKVLFSGAGVWKATKTAGRHALQTMASVVPLLGSATHAMMKPETRTAQDVMDAARRKGDELHALGVPRSEVDAILHAGEQGLVAARADVRKAVTTAAKLAVGTEMGLELVDMGLEHVENSPHPHRTVRSAAGMGRTVAKRVLAAKRAAPHAAAGHAGHAAHAHGAAPHAPAGHP